MSDRPSFLFFVADQWRYDWLGCAGHPVLKTPHLDRIAAEGVRFDRCYSVHPLCMATRATWFTGRTPRGHGTRCNGVPTNPALPTMTGALAEAGYRTHGIGKMHLNPWFPNRALPADMLSPEDWPEAAPIWSARRLTQIPTPYYGLQTVDFMGGNGHRGYGNYWDWVLERESRARELMGPPPGMEMNFQKKVEVVWRNRLPDELQPLGWAAGCAERFLAGAGEVPFFLWLSIPDPHPPYTAPPPWCDMYSPADMPKPVRREGELDDLPPHYQQLFEKGSVTAGRVAPTNVPEETHREAAAMACGMMGAFDAMVGRVIAALQASGRLESTVVCFMSDHGQMMGDHWMYSMPPCHMDGTLRVPSVWRFPRRFTKGQVISALVSHLDFAPTVLDLAGVPIPEGRTPPEPEAVPQRAPWPGRSMVPLLTGEAERVQDSVIAENDEDYLGLRMRTLITEDHHLTIYIGQPYGELYDLRKDPDQLHNLWNVPACQNLKKALLAQMAYRFAETDNVLPRRMGHA